MNEGETGGAQSLETLQSASLSPEGSGHSTRKVKTPPRASQGPLRPCRRGPTTAASCPITSAARPGASRRATAAGNTSGRGDEFVSTTAGLRCGGSDTRTGNTGVTRPTSACSSGGPLTALHRSSPKSENGVALAEPDTVFATVGNRSVS